MASRIQETRLHDRFKGVAARTAWFDLVVEGDAVRISAEAHLQIFGYGRDETFSATRWSF